MLFRAQVRSVALTLLQAAITQAGATVTTSKDAPVQAGTTPSIVIYTDDEKTGTGTAPPQFRTDVLTTVEVTVEATTKDAAEALSDTLCETVENTLLGTPAYVMLFEQIDHVESRVDYRGDGAKKHTFVAVVEIKGHATEIFEPSITQVITGMNIYVDSQNIFDPNGTYAPPFNYPVADPTRGHGPDGRIEIGGSEEFGPVLATESNGELLTESGDFIGAP